ncbi:hypothetical protein BC829DRAFT_222447 [Chytridium lagenaria]|nr:hypothetical protein BC829DRAFT_222447 [Chytridium lagenaria]
MPSQPSGKPSPPYFAPSQPQDRKRIPLIRRVPFGSTNDDDDDDNLGTAYVKIPDTQDTRSFMVRQTETSAHIAAVTKRRIVLLQWAIEPYTRFLKLRDIVIPDPPLHVDLLHDGVNITDVVIVTAKDANVISVGSDEGKRLNHGAAGTRVRVDKRFSGEAGGTWRGFTQLPFSEDRRREIREREVERFVARSPSGRSVRRERWASTSPN